MSDVSFYWTQNTASSHFYSGFRTACFPFEKNKPIEPYETFTQWKIEKASSQLEFIKIPHLPTCFFQNLFSVVFAANWVDFPLALFGRGITTDFLQGSDVLSSSFPFVILASALAKVHLPKSGLLFCLCVFEGRILGVHHSQKSSIHGLSWSLVLMWFWFP